MRNAGWILAAAPALFAASAAAQEVKVHPPESLAVGKVAPDIEGEDIGGTKFKLSEYRGKVVVLDFWGHW